MRKVRRVYFLILEAGKTWDHQVAEGCLGAWNRGRSDEDRLDLKHSSISDREPCDDTAGTEDGSACQETANCENDARKLNDR